MTGTLNQVFQRELSRRIALNPAYSLGAFAKSMNYDKAALSRIINGKRQVGTKTYARLAKYLDLPPDIGDRDQPNFEQINDDVFAVLHSYEHFAFLELMQVRGFKREIPWIARKLALSNLVVRCAIDRLLRLGIIRQNKMGHYIDVGGDWTTSIKPNHTDGERRALQRQLLIKAQIALDAVPLTQRDHTSMTFAIHDSQIERAKIMIKKFRRKLAKELSNDPNIPYKNAVYNLTVAFFPLTIDSTSE